LPHRINHLRITTPIDTPRHRAQRSDGLGQWLGPRRILRMDARRGQRGDQEYIAASHGFSLAQE
jgi:hypothetical protein